MKKGYKADHNSIKKNNKRSNIVIVVLLLILIISVSISVWALFYREKPKKSSVVLAPDYAPQQTEANAEMIDEDEEEKLPQQQGGGAVNLTYSKDVLIDLSENRAKLFFANPKKSNQDMLIQIVIQDNVVVQSGLIWPGYQVTILDLLNNVSLSSGKYEGKYVVYYYQKDTGEKAMLNTEIPLMVEVKE